MHLFYAPDITPEHTEFILNEEESGHACRVLRLKTGDQIEVLNGKGYRFLCTIQDAHPKKCKIGILHFTFEAEKSGNIHIAIAPTKNMDRIEWFAEKATELGITHITLIECKNSERRNVKTERLEKVLVSAMKQSKRSFLPILTPLIPFKDFVRNFPNGFIAHCQEGEKEFLYDQLKEDLLVLIGPEGDFSPDEITLALQNGYSSVHLGANRLRTETAGLYACMQMALKKDLSNP